MIGFVGVRAAVLVVAALAPLLAPPALGDGEWRSGRATWFDVQNGDLTTANCHLSWDGIRTGRDVGALSDKSSLFSSSCGICMEVRCQGASFGDGFGSYVNRNNACLDPRRSVYVTIADACPCDYPNNEDSNKRWCCNDDPGREHVDITRDAFSRLADLGNGVIGISWRVVDCSQVQQGGATYADGGSSSSSSSSPVDDGSSSLAPTSRPTAGSTPNGGKQSQDPQQPQKSQWELAGWGARAAAGFPRLFGGR